jgi:hypothetical protein
VVGLGHAGALVGAMPYADMQCMLDDPPGHRNYWSAEYLGGFPDAAVAAFCASAEAMIVPSPSQHAVFPQGARSRAGSPTIRGRHCYTEAPNHSFNFDQRRRPDTLCTAMATAFL